MSCVLPAHLLNNEEITMNGLVGLQIVKVCSRAVGDYIIQGVCCVSRCVATPSNLSRVNMYSNYNQNHQQASSSSDVNPYHQPYQGPIYPLPSTSSSHSAPVPANAYEYDVGILAQQSVYVPGAMIDKKGGSGGKLAKGGKRTTVLRKGGGKTWEDQTLLEWNPCRFPHLLPIRH
jgi:hypothetical protein